MLPDICNGIFVMNKMETGKKIKKYGLEVITGTKLAIFKIDVSTCFFIDMLMI